MAECLSPIVTNKRKGASSQGGWSNFLHLNADPCSKIGHGFRKIVDFDARSGLFLKVCSKIAHDFQRRVLKSTTPSGPVVENLTPRPRTVVEFLPPSGLFVMACSKMVHDFRKCGRFSDILGLASESSGV